MGQPPYGYIKDPQDKHALLVDPEAAEVVKSIFSMFLSGKNKRGITLYLNDHGKVKIRVALCEGKQAHSKKEALKEREAKREMDRVRKGSRE